MLAQGLRTFLRLNPGEGQKVLLFALLGALFQGGLAIGMSASDTIFLAQIGPAHLPTIYLLTPLVMCVYIPVYSFLISRWGIGRVMDVTMLLLALGGGLFSLAVPVSGGGEISTSTLAVLYAAKLYSFLWYIALYSLYWNFIDGFFDILDAKRLYALLAAGCAAGAALGGALVSMLADTLPIPSLFLCWSLCALVALPVGRRIRHTCQCLELDEQVTGEQPTGMVSHVRGLLSTFRRSRFSVVLAGVLFGTMVVTLFVEYQYLAIFSKSNSEAQLAAIFGNLFLYTNIFNLVVNLLLFNRLVSWIGVRNLALLQPLTYAAAFVFLIVEESHWAAVFGFFAYHGVLTSIDFNNTNLLLNALPREGKRYLRTFIEGLCEPMATAVAGGALLIAAQFFSPQQISLVGLGCALLSIGLVLWLREEYTPAMLQNLQNSWLDFSRSEKELLSSLSPEELQHLKQKLDAATETPHSGSRLEAIGILLLNDPAAGLAALLNYLQESDDTGCWEAQALVAQVMASHNQELTQRIILWLDSLPAHEHPVVLQLFARFGLAPQRLTADLKQQPGISEQAAIAAILRSSRDIGDLTQALQIVETLMSGDVDAKCSAIRSLGQFGSERYVPILVQHLRHPKLTTPALRSLLQLARPGMDSLIVPLLEVLDTGDVAERMLCLEVLLRLEERESVPPLFARAQTFSPRERRLIERLLAAIGPATIPTIVAALRSSGSSYAAKSLGIRALARISPPQLEILSRELIPCELRQAYEYTQWALLLSESRACDDSRGLLTRFYYERSRTIVEFVCEFLSLGGKLDNFELVVSALRSTNQKERGNAIDTIQDHCPQNIKKLLLPLVDGRPPAQVIAAHREFHGVSQRGRAEILLAAISHGSTTESACAAQEVTAPVSPEIYRAMVKRLGTASCPVLREILLTRLDRQEDAQTGAVPVMDRAEMLTELHPTDEFSIEEIIEVARKSEICSAGTAGFHESSQEYLVFEVATGAHSVPESRRSNEEYHGTRLMLKRSILTELAGRSSRVGIALARERVEREAPLCAWSAGELRSVAQKEVRHV